MYANNLTYYRVEKTAATHSSLATSLTNGGQWERALGVLRQMKLSAVGSNPKRRLVCNTVDTYVSLFEALSAGGRWEAALHCIQSRELQTAFLHPGDAKKLEKAETELLVLESGDQLWKCVRRLANALHSRRQVPLVVCRAARLAAVPKSTLVAVPLVSTSELSSLDLF